MADGLPPLVTRVSVVGADDLERGFGKVIGALEKSLGAFKKGEDGAKKLGKEFDNLGTAFEKFTDSIVNHAKTIQTVFLSLSTGGALTGVLKNVGDLDKKMFGLSKSAAMTGQSFGAMTRGIADLNAATLLSIADSTEFFKVVSEGTKGVRMTADQISKLGKTLSDEFGPSLDDVTQAFQKLAQIQEKDVFLFRKLDDVMSAEKLGAYSARLIVLNKVSEDQLNTLFRTVYARSLGDKAQSVEQKRMMEYTKIVQEFNRLFQDLVLNIGKELMPAFKSLIPYVKTAAEYLKKVIEKNPGLVKIVGTMAMVGSAAGGLGTIVQGGANIAGTGMHALTALRGTRMLPMYVKSVDGVPGTTGLPGAGLVATLGKALGIAGLAYAAGEAGKQAGDAVGGQAGAGIRAGSKVAEYAGYGAAGGSLFAGVGAIPGAILGGIAGLIASIDDLEETFTGDKTRAADAETAKYDELNKKTKAEAEKGRTERLIKAESEAGIGMDETRFGTALMASRVVKKRLIAGGMSESDARDEAEDAGRGQASSAWLKEQRKIGIADLQPDMAATRKEIGSLIPEGDDKQDKVKEQFEGVPEKLAFIKVQAEQLSLRNFVIEAEQINELLGSITGSLKDQTALELEFYGNAEKAQENIAKTIEYERQAVRLLTQKRNQTLEIIEAQGGLEAAQARALVLQEKGAAITPKEKLELESILGSTAAIAIQDKEIVGHNREILALEQSRSAVYDQRLAVQESELSLMESQAAMVKEMYLGAGPTLEFQMQQVQQLEKMKNTNAANLKQAQAQLANSRAEGKERLDYVQRVNVLQQKQNDLTLKQLSLTKNLREGYLDSMTAMTNAEGTFAKFVLRKDMGMGEMQRNFLAAGGMRSGMVGAGATGPTMRWKPGGGPGALQYMDPDSLKRLGSTYNEEYDAQQIFANMPNALAQTPFGQFGAQAPENGASSMGGRGAGITIQNPQQAAELQNIQREMEQAIKKGEGTQDLQARAAAIQKTAADGTFEGQIVAKMDQIIGIMSGTKPVQDAKTTEAVAEGVRQGQAAVAEKSEQKGRQEATKQAADMRRGTLEKGAPSAAEAAIKKQSDRLDESERREQAKFDAYTKTFGDWDTVAASVNTKFLGIGKQGGGGAAGVQYAGTKGMTTTGYEFEKPFTSEQIKEASRGLSQGVAQAVVEESAKAPPTIPGMWKEEGATGAEIENLRKQQQQAQTDKEAFIDKYGTGMGQLQMMKPEENKVKLAENEARRLRENIKQAEARKEQLKSTGDPGEGWLRTSATFVKDELVEPVVEVAKFVASGVKAGARLALRKDEKQGAQIMKDLGEDQASAIGAGRQYRQENASNELVAIDVALKASKAKLAKIEKDKAALEEESVLNTAARIVIESATNSSKEGAYAAAKREKELGEQISAKEEERQKSIEAAIQEGEEFAKSVMERQMEPAKERESGVYFEGKRQISEKAVQQSEERMRSETEHFNKEKAFLENRAMLAEESGKGEDWGLQVAGLRAAAQKAADDAAEAEARHERFIGGAEVTGRSKGIYDETVHPPLSGTGEGPGRMPDSENEFALWKQSEELKKLNVNAKEGNQIAQEVGKKQVDASKEAGQNIKSSLEQQKIDVTPVVTAVDSGVMQAKASGGWIARMAGGGKLPGFGGGDRVLAMLEPGEFVVNKNAANAFPALLDSINKNRYANGGTVGMLPSPAMARAGGTIMPRFNISVRGDTAKTLVDSVGSQLSGLLNDMFTPQGTSGRLYDLGS